MYSKLIKRTLDIILSLIGIIFLLIPFLIISLIIKADTPGPAFFTQKRVGQRKDGKLTYFQIIKFRTMKVGTPMDVPTHLLDLKSVEFTKIQSFLRKFSIDELPQVFNILKGEMSVVGPRPALWNQYDLIEERDKYGANDIRPGLTGWAQINGRDTLGIEEKAAFDGEYVRKAGFCFDCKCFFRTIMSVIRRDGVIDETSSDSK